MARPRERLTRAPIVEAIIDIRLAATTAVSLERLGDAQTMIGEDYPRRAPLASLEATFGTDSEELTHRRNEVGFLFRSGDDRSVAQLKIDGFTFNRLEPYTDWPTVFGEALRLWRIYHSMFPEIRVARLGVRYINRMTVAEGAGLGEYLTVPPTLPTEVPQHLTEFLWRIAIEDVDRDLSAVVVQALEPGPARASAAVLLDIDAFRSLERNLEPDNAAIVEIFEQLREFKNRIFYAFITETAAERFE